MIIERCLVYDPGHVLSHIPNTRFLNVTLVMYGYLSSNPINPTLAFALPTLEVFRCLRLWSPHVSLQAWVRVLCDIHNVSLLFIYVLIAATEHFVRSTIVAISVSSLLGPWTFIWTSCDDVMQRWKKLCRETHQIGASNIPAHAACIE